MIRLAPLPFQQHQQQQKQSHHHHQHHREQSKGTLHLFVFVGFLFFCISSRFSVLADGPHCNTGGHGPSDIIMATGRVNPKYSWYKRGHKTYVPVVLDPLYSYKERSTILGGLNEIQEKTCMEFDVYDDEHSIREKDYVFITRTTKRGCWSYIGNIGRGRQELGLPPGCITHRTAMHEMMHALGFRHEHIRHDRDDYVIIYWENIKQGRESNFQKRVQDNFVPGPYDYDSIMHYERRAFSKNKQDTIRPLKSGVKIGVRQTMSHWDAKKINIMYGCQGGGGGGGHLSWSPEHDDPLDFHVIDGALSLPRNSSSPPSSAEIEVAYDELDYDPGRDLRPSVGSGGHSPRSGHYSHEPRSFYPRDEYHHSGPSHLGHYHHQNHNHDRNHNSHQSGYPRNRNHGHGNEYDHDDDDNGIGHGNSNRHPQSFNHFTLDTYPNDDGPSRDHAPGRIISENDDFYDF